VLASRLQVPYLSSGELFRHAVAERTALGQRIAARLAAGELVPDEETNAFIAERLREPDAAAGFVLDGYPRDLAQGKFLAALTPSIAAVLLEIPDDEAVRRLLGRRVCVQCAETYHLVHRPPRRDEVCDRCGGELVRRHDDTEAAIRRRLVLYHRKTEPLITFYEAQGLLVRVDGRPPIAAVAAAVARSLGL
jgi:adenylate kinase